MIPMLSVEEAKRRGKEAGINEQLAGLNIFRAMLHNPVAAGALANILTTLLLRGKLDPPHPRAGDSSHRMAQRVGVRVLPARAGREAPRPE